MRESSLCVPRGARKGVCCQWWSCCFVHSFIWSHSFIQSPLSPFHLRYPFPANSRPSFLASQKVSSHPRRQTQPTWLVWHLQFQCLRVENENRCWIYTSACQVHVDDSHFDKGHREKLWKFRFVLSPKAHYLLTSNYTGVPVSWEGWKFYFGFYYRINLRCVVATVSLRHSSFQKHQSCSRSPAPAKSTVVWGILVMGERDTLFNSDPWICIWR